MIDKFDLTDFRSLHKFDLAPEKINVFVGRNNTGKSSVLEAITIAAASLVGYRDALGQDVLSKFAERRNWKLQYFVRLGSDSSNIKISRNNRSSLEEIEVTLRYLTKTDVLSEGAVLAIRNRASEMAYRRYGLRPSARGRIESEIARDAEIETTRMFESLMTQPKLLVSTGSREDILLQGEKEVVTSSRVAPSPGTSPVLFTGVNYESDLKQLHDLLLPTARFAAVMETVKEGIDYLADLRTLGDDIFVYQRKMDRPIPISLMGDGFRDVLRILFISALTRNGIAIFEEPENSLHPGFLGLATEYLSKAALEGKTQFFISTHSLEFLQYMLEKAANHTKIIRMSQTDNEVSYEVLTGKEALEESKEIGTDLRGV